MNEEQKVESKEALENTWVRLIYMLLFMVVSRMAGGLLFLMSLFQFVWVFINNEKHQKVFDFSTSVVEFILQIGKFISYQSEEKPFPFADWPEADKPNKREPDAEKPAETSTVKKPTVKKVPVKKAAPKSAAKSVSKTEAEKKPAVKKKPVAKKKPTAKKKPETKED